MAVLALRVNVLYTVLAREEIRCLTASYSTILLCVISMIWCSNAFLKDLHLHLRATKAIGGKEYEGTDGDGFVADFAEGDDGDGGLGVFESGEGLGRSFVFFFGSVGFEEAFIAEEVIALELVATTASIPAHVAQGLELGDYVAVDHVGQFEHVP
jgi:hypothetical protein